jgi:hypothetical protein
MGKKNKLKVCGKGVEGKQKSYGMDYFVGHFYFVCTFSFDEGCRLLQ